LFDSGGANSPYDIAVFLLDKPVTGVTPATLPTAGLLDQRVVQGQTFVAVGYGTVRETNRTGQQAFQVGWRCTQASQHVNSVTKAWVTFSMNLATGNGGTCYGDSGGPHFLGDVVVADGLGGLRLQGDRQGLPARHDVRTGLPASVRPTALTLAHRATGGASALPCLRGVAGNLTCWW
jgi:hypothetical protein